MATTKAFEIGDLGTNLQVDASGNVTAFEITTSEVDEGTNLYYTDARARAAISVSGNLTYDSGTGVLGFTMPTTIASLSNHDTDDLAEGTTNLYFTSARARASISGGTGITYSSSTGQAELTASGVTAGSYGSSSLVPQITVDAYGRITSIGTTNVAGVTSVTYNATNSEELTINTADGGVHSASLALGGSLNGPLNNITIKYAATAPSTPIQGTFYFDSLNQKMKVYTGSTWVDAVPAGTGSTGGGETTDAVATMEKFQYTIASSTNAVNGSDDNGNTLSYIVDGSQNIEVFVNGIKQFEGATNDYVATTGSSVTFTYNLPVGSVVDIQVYELLTQDAFYLKSETFTKTETNTQISNAVASYVPLSGGTMTGDLVTTGLTVDTNTLYVDSTNNRVGVGTTNPQNNLHVNAGAGGGVTFESNSGVNIDVRYRVAGVNKYNVGYVAADNALAWYDNTALAERMRLNNAGRLGIGSADPQSTLHVHAPADDGSGIRISRGGQAAYMQLYPAYSGIPTIMSLNAGLHMGYNSNTDGIRIDTNNRVGIGAATPAFKLDVSGSVRATSPNESDWAFIGYNSLGTAPSGLWYSTNSARFLGRDASNNLTVSINATGTSYLKGGNVAIGLDSADEQLTVANVIKVVGTADPGVRVSSDDTNYNGMMRFNTTDNTLEFLTRYASTYYTNNLVLKQGNVGIGTSDPSVSLQVGDATGNYEFITVNGAAGQYTGIKLARGAGDWSSAGNNNYGMLVTDSGFEISKFTSKGENATGRNAYIQLDDGKFNVNVPLGLPQYTSNPTGTRAGQLYFNTASNVTKYYDGTQWRNISENDPTSSAEYRTGFDGSTANTGTGSNSMSLGGSYSYTSTAKFGQALDFGTAQTGYGRLTGFSSSNFTYSYGGWWYIHRANTVGRSYIIDQRVGDLSSGYWLFDDLNSMTIKCHDSEDIFSYTVPTGQWVHWAVVSNQSANYCKFYVNGSVYRTISRYADSLSDDIAIGTYRGVIGSSGHYFINAIMDQFFCTTTAFSDAEILNIYNSSVDY